MAALTASWMYFAHRRGRALGRHEHEPGAARRVGAQPSSLAVGASGKAGWRLVWDTMSTRILPPSTSGLTSPGWAMSASTWPPSSAGLDSPQPENGTWVKFDAAQALHGPRGSDGSRSPRPATPPGACPGWPWRRRRTPARVFQGASAFTASERVERDHVDDRLVVVGRLVRQVVELRVDDEGGERREDHGVAVGLGPGPSRPPPASRRRPAGSRRRCPSGTSSSCPRRGRGPRCRPCRRPDSR